MKTIELAGDVIAGSTTFAGLIIVYIGAVGGTYLTYQPREQKAVRAKFQRRATVGAVGVAVAACAAAAALIGKWTDTSWPVGLGAILMVLTLAWGVASAIEIIVEIR